MSKASPIVILSLMLTYGSLAYGQGGNIWEDSGSDNLWTNTDNWAFEVVPPNSTSHPYTGWDDPNGIFYPLTPDPSDDQSPGVNDVKLARNGTLTLVDDSVTHALAYGVRVGNGGANNTLQVTGGRLDIGIDPNAPANANAVGWHLQVGRGYPGFDSGPINADPLATVLMSGGEINTNGLLIPEQFVDNSLPDPTDSAPLNGELIMSGGVINARWMNLGQLKGNGTALLSGDAQINIAGNVPGDPANGGELSFNRDWFLNGLPVPSSGDVHLDVSQDAIITIFGHVSQTIVSPDAGELARYESHVATHELTAWDGTASPVITLDTTTGPAPFITIEAPVVPGDADNDGDVDLVDLDILGANFGAGPGAVGGASIGDFDDDGDVDLVDLDTLGAGFGLTAADLFPLPPLSSVAVPEPTSSLLLVGNAAALFVARRRYPLSRR